jgi:hypothetical protein
MPSARPHHQRRGAIVQPVRLPRDVHRQCSAHRIDEVPLPLDDIRPGGGACVLQVGHEDARAGVQRVDHHLPIDRTGDLDAAIGQIGR